MLLTLIGAKYDQGILRRGRLSRREHGRAGYVRLAVATSIDALAVGVTFAFMNVSIIPAALSIGCVTFACSAVGVKPAACSDLNINPRRRESAGPS